MDLPAGDAGQLVIRGMVPQLDGPFATRLAITVDGARMHTVEVKPGEVAVTLRLPASKRSRHVVLDFTEGQDLAAPDRRRIGMLIQEIGIR